MGVLVIRFHFRTRLQGENLEIQSWGAEPAGPGQQSKVMVSPTRRPLNVLKDTYSDSAKKTESNDMCFKFPKSNPDLQENSRNFEPREGLDLPPNLSSPWFFEL